MNRTTAFAICLLAATPALAQSTAEKTGVNAVLGRAPTTADFVKEAAVSDMFEIQASQLAAQKGNPQTKAFAQQMITDHQKTSSELQTLVASNGADATLPTQIDSSHQKMLDTLRNLSGSKFDSRYRTQQISAHKDAVSLFQRYAKNGDNAALKDWAGKTEPALEHHLQMAQAKTS